MGEGNGGEWGMGRRCGKGRITSESFQPEYYYSKVGLKHNFEIKANVNHNFERAALIIVKDSCMPFIWVGSQKVSIYIV